MNKDFGSNFDDFLEEEGLLAETESVAIKRVIAYQVAQLMKAKKISKLTMSEWQKKELEKRYELHKQGKLELHDWQDVHRELRERHA